MPQKKFYSLEILGSFSKNAFILYRLNSKETIYDYKDVLQAAEQLLSQFQNHQIPQSVGIALKLHGHTPSSCALILGILNHNCYFCPLEVNVLDDDSTDAHLYDTGARFIIADRRNVRHNNDILFQFTIFGEELFMSEVASFKATAVSIVNNCYAIGTSGSTGPPKVVQVPYACIAPNVEALSARWSVSPRDVVFLCAPLTFDPFVIELFVAMRNGAALVITTSEIRLAPNKLLRILFPAQDTQRGVTILQMTPSLFRLFGADGIREYILNKSSSLRILILGGEVFPTRKELSSWMPQKSSDESNFFHQKRIFNIYGITEMSCWSSLYECTKLEERYPIGATIDSETKLLIRNAEGSAILAAGKGELYLGSATRKCHISQMVGEDLKLSGKDVLFRATGDLVERDEKDDIYYIGRINNTIKRIGKRICLDSLSQHIELILSGLQARAVCLWDENTHKLVCCLAAANKNTQLINRLLLEQLSDYEKPDRIFYVKEMPLNAHGKVDRRRLILSNATANSLLNRKPVEILKKFLSETLALQTLESSVEAETYPREAKRKKHEGEWNMSFVAAGGTSFHALSLASEISELLDNPTDQRLLLEMLLNKEVGLLSICEFVEKAKVVNSRSEIKLPPFSTKQRMLSFIWRTNLHKCVDSTPAHASTRYICVGSHSHLLLTVDACSGKEIARILLPDRIECQVVFASNHMALVGCYDGHLYAFNFLHGEILWRISVSGMIKAKPVIFLETVLVGSYAENYNCVSICLKTQKTLWRSNVGRKGIFSAPISIGLTAALVCSLDGTYGRINANTGQVEWTHKCSSPIFSTPALILDETQFVIAEVSGKVHVCFTKSGDIIHSFSGAAGNVFSSISIRAANDRSVSIIFGCHDHNVYCVKYMRNTSEESSDVNPMSLLWKSRLNSPIYATPVVMQNKADDFIVACSTKGLLTVLDANSGHLVAMHDVQAEVFSTPCYIAEHKIYFGCRDNFLYCFSFE